MKAYSFRMYLSLLFRVDRAKPISYFHFIYCHKIVNYQALCISNDNKTALIKTLIWVILISTRSLGKDCESY